MPDVSILEIGIDPRGRLYVRPDNHGFPHIYRAATEVRWDEARGVLFAPEPVEWSYLQWFKQIAAAVAGEYGIRLKLTKETAWIEIPETLQAEILADLP